MMKRLISVLCILGATAIAEAQSLLTPVAESSSSATLVDPDTREEGASNSSDSSTSASPSSEPRPTPSAYDREELKVTITETTFNLDPSLENRAALILARERLLELECMPRIIATLEHPAGPRGERCVKELTNVFLLDSSSPVAFCARDGIDSQNCSDAYRNQTVSTYGEPYQPPSRPEPLRPGMRPTIQDTNARLMAQIEAIRALPEAKRTVQSRILMRQLFDRLLTLNCVSVRLALQEIPSYQDIEQSQRQNILNQPLSENMPVDAYVDALVQDAASRKKKGPEAEVEETAEQQPQYGPAFARTRLLPNACMHFVREALAVEPEMATAVCHRDGVTSPMCIHALRREVRANQEALQKERIAQASATTAPGGPSASGRSLGQSSKSQGFKTF